MRNFVNAINEFPHAEERPWARLGARATAMQHLLVLRRQGGESAGAAWLETAGGGVAILILTTFVARLVFAASLGLGIDESYMVAAGRKLQLSYFDHPPIAWWLAWGMAHLTGSESAVVVRLPFIVLFALTTFLLYR